MKEIIFKWKPKSEFYYYVIYNILHRCFSVECCEYDDDTDFFETNLNPAINKDYASEAQELCDKLNEAIAPVRKGAIDWTPEEHMKYYMIVFSDNRCEFEVEDAEYFEGDDDLIRSGILIQKHSEAKAIATELNNAIKDILK